LDRVEQPRSATVEGQSAWKGEEEVGANKSVGSSRIKKRVGVKRTLRPFRQKQSNKRQDPKGRGKGKKHTFCVKRTKRLGGESNNGKDILPKPRKGIQNKLPFSPFAKKVSCSYLSAVQKENLLSLDRNKENRRQKGDRAGKLSHLGKWTKKKANPEITTRREEKGGERVGAHVEA